MKLCAPLFVELESTKRTQILDTINTLFFGSEDKEDKLKEKKEVMKALEANLAKIKTLGAFEVGQEDADSLLTKMKVND